MIAMVSVTSCKIKNQVIHHDVQVDSLLNAAYQARDYDRILSLSDSLQADGSLSEMKAHYWRGYAYNRQRKMRLSEMEWKKAIGLSVNTDEDLEYYAKCANRLTGQLELKTDYEGTLRIAMDAMKILEEKDFTSNTDYMNLIAFVGNCQLRLGHVQEAAQTHEQAYRDYLQIIGADNDLANYTSSIIGLVSITDAYVQTGNYKDALAWTERFDNLLQLYREQPRADEDFMDRQSGRLYFYKSTALEGLGRTEEAREAYQQASKTRYAQTPDGLVESTAYLTAAERWSEAADKYSVLSEQMRRYEFPQTLDNIRTYVLPKYKANYMAHRRDSAIAISALICDELESAIAMETRETAAELATIYDTQKKETQLAEQEARINQQRFTWSLLVLLLVILASAMIIRYRSQANRRLKTAYHKLDISNARAEEASRMKSHFIQQISHEIRTPLNIVSGFAQVITTPDIELDEQTRHHINHQITQSTGRITSLIKNMLELSDVISQTVLEKNDTASVEQIALEAAESSGITTARHLEFHLDFPPEIEQLTIRTNKTAAVRALSLILDNARKFTAPAEDQDTKDTAGSVSLKVHSQDGSVVFTIEDTGIGIPPAMAEKIFEEFVQLDDYYEGTGIGLTLARALSNRLGGDLRLDTEYTDGARFILSLPLESQD